MLKNRKLTRRDFLRAGGVAMVGGALGAGVAPRASFAAPAVARKVKLQWIEWITPEISEQKMQEVLNAFYQSEAGKNIEIERQPMPYAQIHDKIVALHLAGQVPDVLNMNAPWAVEFAEQGILEPLNPYLEKAGKDWTANLVTGPMVPWKRTVYLVPLTSIPFLLYYNEKKLAEAGFGGPPKTWADVETMGVKLTNPAKNTYCYASGMAAKSPYNGCSIEIFPLIYQSNDTVMKNSKCNLNSPAAVKALKFWLKLVYDLKIYAPGVLTNIEKDKLEAFGAEQTALMWSNVAHVAVLEQRNPQLKFGLAPLPSGETFGTVLTGWNTSMARNGKNKEAAWQFVSWLSGPEGNARMSLAAKHLPANTKADVSEVFKRDPRLKIPVDILSRGRVLLEAAGMPKVTELFRILVEQIHEAATKRKTPEQALEFATAEWNKIIAEVG
jgi:multiple sugar transport system substrate-binding protein